MMKLAAVLCAGAALGLAGCGGSDSSYWAPADGGASSGGEMAGLFAAPSGAATPDSIYGLWGGTTKDGSITFDTRQRFAPSKITAAINCKRDGKSSMVGLTVAARVSDTEIAVLESGEDRKVNDGVTCSVSVAPKRNKRCDADDGVPSVRSDCFSVEGTTLRMYGKSQGKTSPNVIELTKLSD